MAEHRVTKKLEVLVKPCFRKVLAREKLLQRLKRLVPVILRLTSHHDGFHTRPYHHEHHGGCLRIQHVSFASGSDNDGDLGYLK
jgi:hypothetical protein